MAFAAVSYIASQFENQAGYWIKFYEQGTTTPKVMATDSAGGTTLAKAEISSGGTVPIGFIQTVGDAILIPFVDGDYDLWAFPTSAEADANDTTNAIQLADNITSSPYAVALKEYDTLTAAVADVANLSIGDVVILKERTTGNGGGATWDVVDATTVTENEYSIVTGDATRSFVLRTGEIADANQFGATGDGSTDDTPALQFWINYCANNSVKGCISDGHFKFTKLYFNYDAANNVGWNNVSGDEGGVVIEGSGSISEYNLINSNWRGTVLDSTDSTGPAIEWNGNGVGKRMSNMVMKALTVVASNTTQVIKIDTGNHFVGLEDIVTYQKSTGDGIVVEQCWVNKWENVFSYGLDSTGTSGVGLIFRTLAAEDGGGNNLLLNVNAKHFGVGWEIGHATFGSGAVIQEVNCINCHSTTNANVGVRIGHGAKSINWDMGYIEKINDGSNGGIGLEVINGAQNVNVTRTWFSGNDIGASIGDGTDGTSDRYRNVLLANNQFNEIMVKGIQVFSGASSTGIEINKNVLFEAVTPPGATIGIDIENVVFEGLVVTDNDIDSALDTDVTFEDRIDIYTKRDSNGYPSVIKMGKRSIFTASDATPSVASGRSFQTEGTAVTITDFDDGIENQEITVIVDTNTTIDFSTTNLKGNGGVDWTPAVVSLMNCAKLGSSWYCNVGN